MNVYVCAHVCVWEWVGACVRVIWMFLSLCRSACECVKTLRVLLLTLLLINEYTFTIRCSKPHSFLLLYHHNKKCNLTLPNSYFSSIDVERKDCYDLYRHSLINQLIRLQYNYFRKKCFVINVSSYWKTFMSIWVCLHLGLGQA